MRPKQVAPVAASDLMSPSSADLIPLSEVARRLGKSIDTVNRWARREGGLQTWRLGRTPFTSQAALDAFIRAGLQPQGRQASQVSG